MSAVRPSPSRSVGAEDQRPGVGVLRLIIACNVLSTSVHYTHNFVMAEMYPPVPVVFPTPLSYQIGIVVFWPLLTALGLWGYRLYREGNTRRARPLLVAYAMLGFTTIGHFVGGNPDIPPFFYVTLFTDFLAGSALLVFVAWTLTVRTRWRSGPAAASAGPFFISFTEFTPQRPHDVLGIYLAARRLMAECAGLDGAVGLTTYWRLREWKGGSLSVWEGPDALRGFVGLPFHLEIMRTYRSRGVVRSAEWWSQSFDLRQALEEGQRAVEG